MADERTPEASRDMGKDLEVSPPQLQPTTTSWWIHPLHHRSHDTLPDPRLVSASTPEAEYVVDAPTKQRLSTNTGLDLLSTGTSAASGSTTDNRKRKGKGEYPSTEDPDCICTERNEESPSEKKLKTFRETHNLSERHRRAKITQQFQKLQQLIPPGDTASQASILDRAVTHIKSLKGLLQMLSMMSPENAKVIQQFHSEQ